MIVIMEKKIKFEVKTNLYKKYLPNRKGLVIEVNGEGVIGIVPSSNEESFIMFENGSKKMITDTETSQFEMAELDDFAVEFKIGEGLEIMTYNDKNEKEKSYFIPVKSDWIVEFRNRRAIGKTWIQGNSVWLNIKR